MTWFVYVLIAAAIFAIGRIGYNIRKVRASEDEDDWDSRNIARLRKMGSDPFQAHVVDFFLALPSEAACRAVGSQLEAQGYEVSSKPVPQSVDHPFSLHAMKSLQLSVPDMRERSRLMKQLAKANGGRYDGWTAAVVEHTKPYER
jgi:hypothetical protein